MKRQLSFIVPVALFLVLLNLGALLIAFNESGANYSSVSLRTMITQAGYRDLSVRNIKGVGFPYSARGLLAWAIAFGVTLVVSSLTIKAVSLSASNNDKSNVDMQS